MPNFIIRVELIDANNEEDFEKLDAAMEERNSRHKSTTIVTWLSGCPLEPTQPKIQQWHWPPFETPLLLLREKADSTLP